MAVDPSGTKMYVVQSRAEGKSVRVTVGRHGVITADEARRRAARIVNRIKAGEDPVAEPLPARLAGGPTVADLAARYMEEHVAVRCKGSTAEGGTDHGPALGAIIDLLGGGIEAAEEAGEKLLRGR